MNNVHDALLTRSIFFPFILAENRKFNTQTNTIFRFTDAPPTMEYTFIEQTLQPGPTVSLKCSASGNPTPSMSWSLDGFKLPDHPR